MMIWKFMWPLWALVLLVIVGFGLCAYRWNSEYRKGYRDWWNWVRRILIIVLLAVIGAQPAILHERKEDGKVITNLCVYFVVDTTGSMAAEDYDGSEPRLNGVRHDIRAIAQELPGARYSVLTFAATAQVELPLTTDEMALSGWTDTLHQEDTYNSYGTGFDRIARELRRVLDQDHENNPTRPQIVFFFTDGERNKMDSDPFVVGTSHIEGGAVLGYGTAAGGKMKIYDPSGLEEGYITDKTQPGEPEAISVYDPVTLAEMAKDMGLPYVQRDAPTSVTDITSNANAMAEKDVGDGDVNELARDIIWPFATALAVLLAWEVADIGWRLRKMRRTGAI